MRDQLVCLGCWKWYSGRTDCPTCKTPLVDPETGQPAVSTAAVAPQPPTHAAASAARLDAPPLVVGYPGGAQLQDPPRLHVRDYLARHAAASQGEEPVPRPDGAAPTREPAPPPVPPAAPGPPPAADPVPVSLRFASAEPPGPPAAPAPPAAGERAPLPPPWPATLRHVAPPEPLVAPRPPEAAPASPVAPPPAVGGPGWGVRAGGGAPVPPSAGGAPPRPPAAEAPLPVAAQAVRPLPDTGRPPATFDVTEMPRPVREGDAPPAPARVAIDPRPAGGRRVLVGAASALASGVVVAALWVAVSVATGLELAPLAVVVGAVCGLAMRRWGRAAGAGATLSALLVAVVAIGLGLVFSALAAYTDGQHASFLDGLGLLDSSFVPHLSAETGSVGAALGVAGALAAGLAVVVRGRRSEG